MSLRLPRFADDPDLRAASENKPPLRQGAKGEGVAILQQALVDLGFRMPRSTRGGDSLPDGIYGAETAATVKSFQGVNGLQADGVAGRQTLGRLEDLLIVASEAEQAKFRAELRRVRPID
jgi:peptidoglycan hydrolase-like protein with peptidoglycan-binding domain